MSYDDRGKVSLWKNDTQGNDKAPVAKGTVVAHRDIKEGERLNIALWKSDNQNPKAPSMTGRISDPPYLQPGGPPEQKAPPYLQKENDTPF